MHVYIYMTVSVLALLCLLGQGTKGKWESRRGGGGGDEVGVHDSKYCMYM